MGNCQHKAHDAVVHKIKEEGGGVFRYDKDARRIVYAGEDAKTELILAPSGSESVCSHKPSKSNVDDENGNKAKEKSVLGEIAEFTEYLEDDNSTINTQTTYGRNQSPNPFLISPPQHQQKATNKRLSTLVADPGHPDVKVGSRKYSVSPLAFEDELIPNNMDRPPQDNPVKAEKNKSNLEKRYRIDTKSSDDYTDTDASSGLDGIFHVRSEDSDDLLLSTTSASVSNRHQSAIVIERASSDPVDEDWDNDFFSAPSCSADGSSQTTPRSWVEIADLPKIVSKKDRGNLNDSELVLLDESVSSFENIAVSLQVEDKETCDDDVDANVDAGASSNDDEGEPDATFHSRNEENNRESESSSNGADVNSSGSRVGKESEENASDTTSLVYGAIDDNEFEGVTSDPLLTIDVDNRQGGMDAKRDVESIGFCASNQVEEESKEDKMEQKIGDDFIPVVEFVKNNQRIEQDSEKEKKTEAGNYDVQRSLVEEKNVTLTEDIKDGLTEDIKGGFIPIGDSLGLTSSRSNNTQDDVEQSEVEGILEQPSEPSSLDDIDELGETISTAKPFSLKNEPSTCAEVGEDEEGDVRNSAQYSESIKENSFEKHCDDGVYRSYDLQQEVNMMLLNMKARGGNDRMSRSKSALKEVDGSLTDIERSLRTTVSEDSDKFNDSGEKDAKLYESKNNEDDLKSSDSKGATIKSNESDEQIAEIYDNFSFSNSNISDFSEEAASAEETGFIPLPRTSEPAVKTNYKEAKRDEVSNGVNNDSKFSVSQGNATEPRDYDNNQALESNNSQDESDEEIAEICDKFDSAQSYSSISSEEVVTAEKNTALHSDSEDGSEHANAPDLDCISIQSYNSVSTDGLGTSVEETGFIPLTPMKKQDAVSVSSRSIMSNDDSYADYDPAAPFILGATKRMDQFTESPYLQESSSHDINNAESTGDDEDLSENLGKKQIGSKQHLANLNDPPEKVAKLGPSPEHEMKEQIDAVQIVVQIDACNEFLKEGEKDDHNKMPPEKAGNLESSTGDGMNDQIDEVQIVVPTDACNEDIPGKQAIDECVKEDKKDDQGNVPPEKAVNLESSTGDGMNEQIDAVQIVVVESDACNECVKEDEKDDHENVAPEKAVNLESSTGDEMNEQIDAVQIVVVESGACNECVKEDEKDDHENVAPEKALNLESSTGDDEVQNAILTDVCNKVIPGKQAIDECVKEDEKDDQGQVLTSSSPEVFVPKGDYSAVCEEKENGGMIPFDLLVGSDNGVKDENDIGMKMKIGPQQETVNLLRAQYQSAASPSNRTVLSEGDISFDAERSQTDVSYAVSVATGNITSNTSTAQDDDLSFDETVESSDNSKENESIRMNQNPSKSRNHEPLDTSGFNRKVGKILESVEKQIKINEKILKKKGVILREEISSYEASTQDELDQHPSETTASIDEVPVDTTVGDRDDETECLVEEVATLLTEQLAKSDDSDDLTPCSSAETDPRDEVTSSKEVMSVILKGRNSFISNPHAEQSSMEKKGDEEDEEMSSFNKTQLDMTNLLTEDLDIKLDLESPLVTPTAVLRSRTEEPLGNPSVFLKKQRNIRQIGKFHESSELATKVEIASLITQQLENDLDQESPLVTPVTALEKETYGMQVALARKTRELPLLPRSRSPSTRKAHLTKTTVAEITSLLTEHLDKSLDGCDSPLVSPMIFLDRRIEDGKADDTARGDSVAIEELSVATNNEMTSLLREQMEKNLDSESPLVSPVTASDMEVISAEAALKTDESAAKQDPPKETSPSLDDSLAITSSKSEDIQSYKEINATPIVGKEKNLTDVQMEHVEFIRKRFSPRKPRASSIPRARDSPVKSGTTYRGDRKSSIQAPSPKRTGRVPAPKTPPRSRVLKTNELTPTRSNAKKKSLVKTSPRSRIKCVTKVPTSAATRKMASNSSSPIDSPSPTKPWDENSNAISIASTSPGEKIAGSPAEKIITSPGKKKTPSPSRSLKCTPVPMKKVKKDCTDKWDPYQFHVKAGCERCLDIASERERDLFLEHGRHPRITRTSGGCNNYCTRYLGQRFYDEQAPRLCRICFHATHRKLGQSKHSEREVPRRKPQAEYV